MRNAQQGQPDMVEVTLTLSDDWRSDPLRVVAGISLKKSTKNGGGRTGFLSTRSCAQSSPKTDQKSAAAAASGFFHAVRPGVFTGPLPEDSSLQHISAVLCWVRKRFASLTDGFVRTFGRFRASEGRGELRSTGTLLRVLEPNQIFCSARGRPTVR